MLNNYQRKLYVRKRALTWLFRLLIAIVVLLLAGLIAFSAIQLHGRKSLYEKSTATAPLLLETEHVKQVQKEEEEALEEAGYVWQEGDIRYQGDIYRYNEDMLTFLFLGIDDMDEVERKEEGISGGQSDAIFLLCINSHKKEISIIGINRDTITDIDIYTEDGNFLETAPAQITLQHGYGDGAEVSCERTVKAVGKLFYDIPIHGYCAINMGAIPLVNDAVGGVELVSLQTFTGSKEKTSFVEGETYDLQGMMAYEYLHDRNIHDFNSAGLRLERQKQYIVAYAKKAIAATKKDLTTPVTLYQTLSKYMVTDIMADEVTYLASQVVGYSFDTQQIYSLEGKTVMGEAHEEFYPDEEALYELIINIFYEKVTDTDKNGIQP